MEPSTPTLSVVIPVFNGGCFLGAAVESVLACEYDAVEIIVIDDGSTDDTPDVVARFGGGLRYVRQENGGPAAARNAGLRLSRGPIVGFLDADDLWTPEVVGRALPTLISNPNIGVVQGRIRDLTAAGGPGGDPVFEAQGEAYRFVNLGSALYRRELFDEVGLFDEGLRFCEDHDWHVRAWERRVPKATVDDVMLLYRRHEGAMTHGKGTHEIGLARIHKRALDRRRSVEPGEREEPLPSFFEYMGIRNGAPEADSRHDDSGAPAASELSRLGLARKDDRHVDASADAVFCFAVVRNESLRLPYWLTYHRNLGISRFFVVDNASTDDTLEYLLAQPDVHVWHTDRSFREARCGTDWTEALLRVFGVGRWCLVADADEILFYERCEERPLPSLCADLDAEGATALATLLLDMYSDRPVAETRYEKGGVFLEACPFFDRRAYHVETDDFFGHKGQTSFFGGVRRRVFGGGEEGRDERYFYCLNKVPLFRYDPGLVPSENFHWLRGARLSRTSGCLLHFKFVAPFVEQARDEALRGEHWNGAIQYTTYARALADDPDLTLYSAEHSERFLGSRQLVDLGIMKGSESRAVGTTAPAAEPAGKKLTGQIRALLRARRGAVENPHDVGVAHFKNGRYEEAAEAFRRAVAVTPDLPFAHHSLGDALGRLERWDEAAVAFRRAIELNPHFALSHSNLGAVLLKLGRAEEAESAFRAALTLSPEVGPVAKGLARALAQRARSYQEEAGRWYMRANALSPDDDEVYEEAVELAPVDPALCAHLADALARRGLRHKAVFLYQLALQARPDHAETLVKLAGVLEADAALQGALECLIRAAAADPERVEYAYRLGDVLLKLDRTAEAEKAYRTALAREPYDALLQKKLGDALAKAGRIDEAGAAYARAIELGFKAY